MEPGAIPREWRERRVAVRVRFDTSWGFIDFESSETIEVLREALADQLVVLGHKDLDISTIRGSDRRVTRLISQWTYDQKTEEGEPSFAGVRYLSRLDSKWECWAVFEDVRIQELVRQPIFAEDAALRKVATTFGLTIH